MYSIFTKYSNYYSYASKRSGYFLLELVIALLFFTLGTHVVVQLFVSATTGYAYAVRTIEAVNSATSMLEQWYGNEVIATQYDKQKYALTIDIKKDGLLEYITVSVSYLAADGSRITIPFVGCKKNS